MKNVFDRIHELGIVPVVKIDDANRAVPLAKALEDGGLPIVEITFRTDAAEQAIQSIRAEMPDVLTGAGTILNIEQAECALDSGAAFLVSPGFNQNLVDHCCKRNIPIIPGCCSPTDIEKAISCGLQIVKFFPAEAMGGLATMKALAGPYPNISFVPTGGINQDNLCAYMTYGRTWAVGGSWMMNCDLSKADCYERITAQAQEAVKAMHGFELAHIGINTSGSDEAIETAGILGELFSFNTKEGTHSVFAGSGIEICKGTGLGEHGHIAIRTNSITRAVSMLRGKGIEVDESTVKMKNGRIAAVNLKYEIWGYALQLLQK